MFWNRLGFLDVLETQWKPMKFACFSCARQSVGWWKREFLNRPLDTVIVHFFFRCPEVGLELSLWGVQRSDYNFNFEVSRGWFRISTLKCPEVGLEFQLWGLRCGGGIDGGVTPLPESRSREGKRRMSLESSRSWVRASRGEGEI